MRDPLKEYVDQHRAELDVAVPSEKLWTNIETAMITAIPAAGITSGISWLKYFAFGLSSAAGAAIVYTVITSAPSPSEQITAVSAPAKTIQVSETPVTPLASPPATEFILMNSAAPLPPPGEELSFIPVISEFIAEDTLQPTAENITPLAAITLNDSVFTGIRRVEVVASSADIIVQGTNGNAVSASAKQVENVIMDVDYNRNDTLLRITVTVECAEKKAGRKKKCVNVNAGVTATPQLNVNVPSGTSVVISNTYGDTKVSSVTGALCEVRSSSGDVHLASISAFTNVLSSYGDFDARDITGNLTARMSSGNVSVKLVKGNVDVASTYGDQVLSDITGNLKANGSSGHITVTNLRGDINAATAYGDIRLTGFKGSARLVSSSGNIVGEQVELTANSTFTTTYGDVDMTLINPLQALSFDLITTYGDILIEKNGEQFRNENKLTLTRGDILIKATSSSGNQVFR